MACGGRDERAGPDALRLDRWRLSSDALAAVLRLDRRAARRMAERADPGGYRVAASGRSRLPVGDAGGQCGHGHAGPCAGLRHRRAAALHGRAQPGLHTARCARRVSECACGRHVDRGGDPADAVRAAPCGDGCGTRRRADGLDTRLCRRALPARHRQWCGAGAGHGRCLPGGAPRHPAMERRRAHRAAGRPRRCNPDRSDSQDLGHAVHRQRRGAGLPDGRTGLDDPISGRTADRA